LDCGGISAYGCLYWGRAATEWYIVFFRRTNTGPTRNVITATLLKTANVTERIQLLNTFLLQAVDKKPASRSGVLQAVQQNYGA